MLGLSVDDTLAVYQILQSEEELENKKRPNLKHLL